MLFVRTHGANDRPQRKGVKSVRTGHEKDWFTIIITIMLTCLGDGTELPPYVVFKQKTLPKNWNFPKEVVVRCQAKGWMDEALVQDSEINESMIEINESIIEINESLVTDSLE